MTNAKAVPARLLLLVAALLLGGAAPSTVAQKQLVNIDLSDAPIQDVLRVLAEVGRVNVVAGEEVRGRVTVRLVNVAWEDALSVVLKSNGFASEREGNIVRVARPATFLREAQLAAERRAVEKESGPLVQRIIPVNYARAQEMLPIVQQGLSPRGKAMVDARTNTIIVWDVAKSSAGSGL